MPNVILDHILFPPNYGGISRIGNAAETAIGESGTPVQIAVFDTNNPSNNITPDHGNDHLTIVNAGDYFITLTSSVDSDAGGGSTAHIELKKNNGTADVPPVHAHRTFAGGTGESGPMDSSGVATLAAGDTVEVWITNDTGAENYTISDIALSLLQVGV